jgi:hypothetical protein
MLINRREVKANVNLLKFMYPNYDVVDVDINPFPTRPAIFTGNVVDKEKFVKIYSDAGLDYIVVSPTSDIDLTNRRILVQVSFEKWKRTVPKYLCGPEGFIDYMSEEDFNTCFKYHWITGKWLIKSMPQENTFLQLVDAFNLPKGEFMSRFFEIVNEIGPYRVESSFITFLRRVKYKNYKGNDMIYRMKLNSFNKDRLERAQNSLCNCLDTNIDNFKLRLLYLMINVLDNYK